MEKDSPGRGTRGSITMLYIIIVRHKKIGKSLTKCQSRIDPLCGFVGSKVQGPDITLISPQTPFLLFSLFQGGSATGLGGLIRLRRGLEGGVFFISSI